LKVRCIFDFQFNEPAFFNRILGHPIRILLSCRIHFLDDSCSRTDDFKPAVRPINREDDFILGKIIAFLGEFNTLNRAKFLDACGLNEYVRS